MEQLRENYPPFAFHSAMNSLGTHDTPRVLTLLGTGSACLEQSRDWRAEHRLSPEQRALGGGRLKVGGALLLTFPGSPTLYYGDEAGMEGFEDPFNRRTYPWGREDQDLLAWFTALGQLRKKRTALRRGDIRYLAAKGPLLAFQRQWEGERLVTALNRGDAPLTLTLPGPGQVLVGAGTLSQGEDGPVLTLPPLSGTVVELLPPEAE
jgi:glycosidase